ncbi:MAG: 4Fe-4S dicluster domain-containing protein [Firmicutes bacterium]|nr:4Fe-4S dicluster domain-containing protein [Bacillota bacterium]
MKRIFVLKEKCNACLNCVVACQTSHAGSGFYAPVRDSEPSRIYVQAVGKSPVPLVCMHCEDPACVKACITGAMRKDPETGIVSNEFAPNKCVGCWMCIMACPYGVISPKREYGKKTAVKCDLCIKRGRPACVDSCPNGAIVYMEEAGFADYKQGLAAAGLAAEGAKK